jgi:GNAT superfamily N-acetyltransferase
MKRGKQFPYSYKYFSVPGDESDTHAIEAHHKDEGKVGHLLWHPAGEILDVQVDEPHRRKGVATGMLDFASGMNVTQPKHSELLTEEGESWARAVGGARAVRGQY